MYAYKAYGDTTLIPLAQAAWESTAPWAITGADGIEGQVPGKVFTIASACNGCEFLNTNRFNFSGNNSGFFLASLVGGVFQVSFPSCFSVV